MSAAPTDFWGIVIPGWIGAVGGAVGAFIGVAAFILSLRNRGGLRTIARNLAPGIQARTDAAPAWRVDRRGQGYILVNASGSPAEVRGISGTGVRTLADLPLTLAVGEALPFTISRGLVGATVSSVRIESADGIHTLLV
ncbi:MAG: hypothetical protein JWN80_1211 [Microbacteriaceae bacterium]|jgi:hypothetical protein|nr:hypothetical protein [Microbacteriaceae bacterium]